MKNGSTLLGLSKTILYFYTEFQINFYRHSEDIDKLNSTVKAS